jgi:long-chain acyl-CoA synthetase
MELLRRLEVHAREAPERVAYREAGASSRELNYAGLWRAAANFGARLRTALPAGGVVMLCTPNVVEYPVAFLGVLAAGCDVFPVSADSTEVELKSLAERAGVSAVVGVARACAALADEVGVVIPVTEVLEARNTDAAGAGGGDLLLCSSGTTGRPKIVVRDAASVDAVSANMVEGVGFRADDRVLAIVPLCHSYGLEHGLLAPVWVGSTVHLCAGLDLGVVMPQLVDGGITLFPSVPSVYDMICQVGDGRRLGALRKAYAAGAPLPASVYEKFEARYGVRIGQLYGATEIGSVSFADPGGPHYEPRGVGRPFTGVRVKVIDPDTRAERLPGAEGEVLVAAPSMLRGYLNESMPATDGGFFSTGDLGRVDEHGNLIITGRLKLLIEVGGQKVNVLEVEELLAGHASVGDAAVVEVRVSETVSRLKAVVTPRDSACPPSPEELRRFLRERLSAFKVPREIEVRSALPRSASGKVLRRLLEAP